MMREQHIADGPRLGRAVYSPEKGNLMFDSKKFLPASAIARLTEIRVSDPLFSRNAAEARVRRPVLAPDGRLNILAADHPRPPRHQSRRRPAGDGGSPRLSLPHRARPLRQPCRRRHGDDGHPRGSAHHQRAGAARGRCPAGGWKLLIASLNRGGLAGASWEMDDPITRSEPGYLRGLETGRRQTPAARVRRGPRLPEDSRRRGARDYRSQTLSACRRSWNRCPRCAARRAMPWSKPPTRWPAWWGSLPPWATAATASGSSFHIATTTPKSPAPLRSPSCCWEANLRAIRFHFCAR